MLYILSELGADERFADLATLGRRADELVQASGDASQGVAYEWADATALADEENVPPPAALLTRVDGRWVRRAVIATPAEDGQFALEYGDPAEAVDNG
jgi:hypothetical protein